MKPSNPFETVHCDSNIELVGNLLDREIIANCSSPVPDEAVIRGERSGRLHELIEEVVDGTLEN